MHKLLIVSLLTATLATTGCTGLILGGAVAGTAAVASTIHDRRTPGTVIDDRNLEAVISRRLLADKTSDQNSHINLTVFNGVVLVTGEAGNQQTAATVLQIVKTTPNVKRVESDIAIMPNSTLISRAGDSAITTKVKTALASLELPNFDPTLINVSTERNNVYLMGLVTRSEATAIANKTRLVSGVQSVIEVFEYVDVASKPFQ